MSSTILRNKQSLSNKSVLTTPPVAIIFFFFSLNFFATGSAVRADFFYWDRLNESFNMTPLSNHSVHPQDMILVKQWAVR